VRQEGNTVAKGLLGLLLGLLLQEEAALLCLASRQEGWQSREG